MPFLKKLFRNAARSYGYQIHKYPTSAFSAIPIFDLSVQFLMRVRGNKLNFIQVGANDGFSGDPLHKYILKYPWHGILIEPQPDVFVELCETYKYIADGRLIFENIAISSSASKIEMYKPRDGDSGVASVNQTVVARQTRDALKHLTKFTVPCITLDELISRHNFCSVDILQIDAEGQDYEVLKSMDLSVSGPLIVQFEHGHLSAREIDCAVKYLSLHGYYVLYGGYQGDTLALHENFPLLFD
jgi:FkbM family methyltransferase